MVRAMVSHAQYALGNMLIVTLRQTPIAALFPYTTLFRSQIALNTKRRRGTKLAGERRRRIAHGPFKARLFHDVLPALSFRSEEHTSELQSRENLVCRLLLEKKHTVYNHVLTSTLRLLNDA